MDIVGIRQDGTEIVLASGYQSKAHCFASASKLAIDEAVNGNKENLVRLSLRDGQNTTTYENDPFLNV